MESCFEEPAGVMLSLKIPPRPNPEIQTHTNPDRHSCSGAGNATSYCHLSTPSRPTILNCSSGTATRRAIPPRTEGSMSQDIHHNLPKASRLCMRTSSPSLPFLEFPSQVLRLLLPSRRSCYLTSGMLIENQLSPLWTTLCRESEVR